MVWKRSKQAQEQSLPGEYVGFLDKDARLEGKLEVAGTLRIDAEVKGSIISKEVVVLGENATVEGEIQCTQLVVRGRFQGTIRAEERVEIYPGASVAGEVYTPCLVIEAGGVLDGLCHMKAAPEEAKTVTIPLRAAN